MSEIKCPHCNQVFTVDESEYAAIVSQVRNAEMEKEISERLHNIQEAMESKTSLKVMEAEQRVAAKSASALKAAEDELSKTKQKMFELQSKLDAEETKKNTEMELQKVRNEAAIKEALEKQAATHAAETKILTEELERYKDFKAKSSTKMIGESLEQHCMDEFDKFRALAFRNDYFEKDNEISASGSKGDFIYRAYDDDGNELVSIMFEMKNQSDTTADNQRHKNADFFKELDKDRKEKNCEYAVLCSLLEADSSLYNQGIVDVSHRYEKMYVIRPQFFITIITVLRNAAMRQLSLRQELAEAKRENVDIINLEEQLEMFKNAFGKNYELASRKFEETISEIDKAILHLQKTKEALTSCDRNLRLANDKSTSITVQKLIKNSPSLKEQYKEAKKTS